MNKTIIMAGVVALVVIGGALYFMGNRQSTGQPQTQTPVITEAPSTVPSSPSGAMKPSGAMMKGEVKEFTVVSKGLNFTPAEIKVKKGDKVKITYKNTLGTHNFTIDKFNVATKTLSAGDEETVEFTVDKAGSFEYYCSVTNHRALGMKGTFIVE